MMMIIVPQDFGGFCVFCVRSTPPVAFLCRWSYQTNARLNSIEAYVFCGFKEDKEADRPDPASPYRAPGYFEVKLKSNPRHNCAIKTPSGSSFADDFYFPPVVWPESPFLYDQDLPNPSSLVSAFALGVYIVARQRLNVGTARARANSSRTDDDVEELRPGWVVEATG
ncbi:hypothetical protein HPB50_016660 [Hyalomma asiaticum]|uniref:Uncharacterized protein n=1 Tax=Hyalomma asiaticum TaxID=266040 RepID=A0ACB7TLX5_HYAAI|nr:hypothetical protein HPB50_016660 [Hyalomma asiaticum]